MRRAARFRSVALVGFDGSGKSTQSKLLRRVLEEGPEKALVFVVHPFGRKLLRAGVRSPLLRSSSKEKPSDRSRTLIRRLVATADMMDIALYLWLVVLKAALAALFCDREVWVVGDRSMDDVLVKHQRQGTLSGKMTMKLRKLVPGFQVTIWLEVAPQVAKARDNDFDLHYYEELHVAYSAAAQRFGWRVVREAGRRPEEVRVQIVEELAKMNLSPELPGPLRTVP